MNTAQAASYTGLADATLRYYRHAGIGPVSYRIGSKVFYDRADLDAWLAVQRAASVRGGAQ
ncbi:helix-turn-helix domain-containing protein [Mycolicibacterium fluoranthenivorans]|uniref:Helix-turn-helix domain-containing protein n=1 Tax=Mycolicibacterium fluoranthenivorans TaxID=258505 RepID=A0A7G8PA18_9MYCO|nr:helix-turn-helix domain-containing protein [Mycolicibacterium fluoranthenivorans]QNJ91184.1 helix-turn-helix domain-containing protein [Mycolicibacterium fluoranthenivorans]